MEYCICTAKGSQERKNDGVAKLTSDGVDTITNLFLHNYRNRKGRGRALHQHSGRNDATDASGETNNSNKRNKLHDRRNKVEKVSM